MLSLRNLSAGILLLFSVVAAAQPQQGYIAEFACEEGRFGLRLPNQLPAVMKLAPAKRVAVLEVEKWEGYTTTRKYVHFEGLTIGLVTFSNDKNRYMVSFAEITDSRWTRISTFKVGETTASARKKIGAPAVEDPSLKLHYGSEGGDIYFESIDGKIRKITYDCYTG